MSLYTLRFKHSTAGRGNSKGGCYFANPKSGPDKAISQQNIVKTDSGCFVSANPSVASNGNPPIRPHPIIRRAVGGIRQPSPFRRPARNAN